MKTIFNIFQAFTFFILLISFPQKLFSISWEEKYGVGWPQRASELPYPRDEAVGFTIPGGNIYLGTGSITPSQISWVGFGDLNEYNPATNRWTSQNSIPVRDNAKSFSVGSKGYMGFGYNDDLTDHILNDLWEFDPSAGAWSQKADFPDTTRTMKFSFGVNGKGYVGGGSVNDLWEFDPSGNTWTFIDSLPFNGSSISTNFMIGTNAYLLGNSITWKFDALQMSWSNVAPFPASAPGVAFELMGMGYANWNFYFYQYDPVADQWSQKAMLPFNYGAQVGGSDSNYGYFFQSDGAVMRYDPNADTWTSIYNSAGYFNLSGKLMTLDGKVYSEVSVYDPVTDIWTMDSNIANDDWLFALNNFGYAIRNGSFQKYDPISGTWTPLNPPGFPIGLTFAVNGKGYSVLAMDSLQNPIADLHEYDPVNDSWISKASYPGTQTQQTIAFTILDKGYLIGGVDLSWSNTPEFWQYDPVNDQWNQKADYPNFEFSYRAFAEEYHGKGYVGLGKTDPTGSDDDKIYSYDPSLNSWTQITSPVGPRSGTISFNVNDTLYFGRGHMRWSMDYSYMYNDLWAMSDTAVWSAISPIQNEMLQVYPNPASNFLSISSDGISEIELFNSSGQKVFSENYSEVRKDFNLDISSLAEGVYYLKAMKEERYVVKKILVGR